MYGVYGVYIILLLIIIIKTIRYKIPLTTHPVPTPDEYYRGIKVLKTPAAALLWIFCALAYKLFIKCGQKQLRSTIKMAFKPGKSGNPAGRTKGDWNKRAYLWSLMQSKSRELIEKLIQMALDGDLGAMRLCIERLLPKINSAPTKLLQLSKQMQETDDKILIKSEILKATLESELDIDDAIKITAMVDNVYSRPPSIPLPPELPADPIEAAKIYQQIIQSS